MMRQIQHLYRIESGLRENRAGPVLRQAVRAHQSRPIVERLRKALVLFKTSRQHLPQSLLGKAIDYALGQWTALELYLGDGRVEIDNNLVENAIRPTAIGKKNWLFIGEAGAGQRGAIIYTIIECCRRQKIDPFAYLRDVFTRLPHLTNQQIDTVTPVDWAKAQMRPASNQVTETSNPRNAPPLAHPSHRFGSASRLGAEDKPWTQGAASTTHGRHRNRTPQLLLSSNPLTAAVLRSQWRSAPKLTGYSPQVLDCDSVEKSQRIRQALHQTAIKTTSREDRC